MPSRVSLHFLPIQTTESGVHVDGDNVQFSKTAEGRGERAIGGEAEGGGWLVCLRVFQRKM